MHKCLTIFTLSLMSVLGSYAYGKTPSIQLNYPDKTSTKLAGLKLKTNIGSSVISQNSLQNKANIMRLDMGVAVEQKLMQDIRFDFKAKAQLVKGSSDSLFNNNQLQSQSRLILGKAEIIWEPMNMIELKAGAISLGDFDYRMLLGRGSFLGAKESLNYQVGNFSSSMFAFQSVPTNRNYSNRLDEVDEGMPAFYMEGIKLGYEGDMIAVKASSAHFAFSNLSNSVAGASQYYGNTVNAIDNTNAEFVYSYIGWANTAQISLKLNHWSFGALGEYVINQAAPTENQATRIGPFALFYGKDSKYTMSVQQIRSEADASVAYYNTLTYGNNNTQGTHFMFKYENEKNQFDIEFTYRQVQEIRLNQLSELDSDEVVYLEFKKAYEIF